MLSLVGRLLSFVGRSLMTSKSLKEKINLVPEIKLDRDLLTLPTFCGPIGPKRLTFYSGTSGNNITPRLEGLILSQHHVSFRLQLYSVSITCRFAYSYIRSV